MRRFPGYLIAGGLVASLVAVSCSFNEPRIRSEPVILQPNNDSPLTHTGCIPLSSNAMCSGSAQNGEEQSPGEVLTTVCQEKTAWYTRGIGWSMGGTSGNECVYEVVTEDSLDRALLSPDQQVRDNAILTVLYLSDRSCENFRAKVFAFRTSATFASGFFTSVLSGTSAITALVSGPAASGLSAANLASSSALNGINTSYYANKMMDQLDAEMESQRGTLKSQILAHVPPQAPKAGPDGPEPTPTAAARPYSGLDAKLDLQAYDNLCSLETLTHSVTATQTPTASSTPAATATPNALVFKPKNIEMSVEWGNSTPNPITTSVALSNPLPTPVAVTSLTLSGPGAGAFNIGTCSSPISENGGNCPVSVTFTPPSQTSGKSNANVSVTGDPPTKGAQLVITGTVKPSQLKGRSSISLKKGSASLTLKNGNKVANIQINDIQSSENSFSVDKGPCTSAVLVPSQSCSANVSLVTPPCKPGTLTVTYNVVSTKKVSILCQ